MSRGYIYVDGHGEKKAILNLVHRLWIDLGLPFLAWAPPVATLRAASLPCFGTLERALTFLSAHRGRSAVYPTGG